MTDYIASSGQTLSGLTVSSTFIDNSGQFSPSTVDVQSGGTLADSSIVLGGSGTVEGGGIATLTTVGGGSLIVDAGGDAAATLIDSVYQLPGAFNDSSIAGLEVRSAGQATNTTITGGNAQIDAGGTATGVLVDARPSSNGGNPDFGLYGTASGVAVQQGVASIYGGGLVGDATVTGSGTLAISAGGSLVAMTSVTDGGLITSSGGIAVPGYSGSNQETGINTGGTQLSITKGGTLLNSGTVDVGAGAHGGARYGPGLGGTLTVFSGGTLSNQGTLLADGGDGGVLGGNGGGGGTIVAAAGATISNSGTLLLSSGLPGALTGGPGAPGSLAVSAGSTLTNIGSISALGAFTVAGTLVLDQGQVTTGVAQGTQGSVLELATSGGPGTLSGLGGIYAGFSTVQVDPDASITFTGTDVLAPGATIQLGDGSTLANGSLAIPAGGTVHFQGASTLDLDGALDATITGFNPADQIDLLGLAPGRYVVSGSGGNVQIVSADPGTSQETLTFAGLAGRRYALTTLTGTAGASYALTLLPVATAIVAHANVSGPLGAGDVVTFDLTPEVPVFFDATIGLPALSLSDGAAAALDEVASTPTSLVFRTTVAGGQSTPDLRVTGLSLNGATLADRIGTPFDTLSVAGLAGSDTRLVVAPATVTPPAPVTGGVTVIGGAGETVFITPKAGSNGVTATATGNDTVISQGTDTIQAGGGADVVYAAGAAATVAGGTGSLTFEGGSGSDMVVGGSGGNAIYGGLGSDTFFGGSGSSLLVAGRGADTLLLAGVGNATLVGGLGAAVTMFGGPGADSFVGSRGGNDVMVGGAGGNSFSLTSGDVAFGGPVKPDTVTAGSGTATIIEGGGGAQVNLGAGTLTSFEGGGAVNYNAGRGKGGATGIVGFTAHDHVTLTGGFTSADAAAAFDTATRGGFGTTLNLSDGTRITVFGVSLVASQVSAG